MHFDFPDPALVWGAFGAEELDDELVEAAEDGDLVLALDQLDHVGVHATFASTRRWHGGGISLGGLFHFFERRGTELETVVAGVDRGPPEATDLNRQQFSSRLDPDKNWTSLEQLLCKKNTRLFNFKSAQLEHTDTLVEMEECRWSSKDPSLVFEKRTEASKKRSEKINTILKALYQELKKNIFH